MKGFKPLLTFQGKDVSLSFGNRLRYEHASSSRRGASHTGETLLGHETRLLGRESAENNSDNLACKCI